MRPCKPLNPKSLLCGSSLTRMTFGKRPTQSSWTAQASSRQNDLGWSRRLSRRPQHLHRLARRASQYAAYGMRASAVPTANTTVHTCAIFLPKLARHVDRITGGAMRTAAAEVKTLRRLSRWRRARVHSIRSLSAWSRRWTVRTLLCVSPLQFF